MKTKFLKFVREQWAKKEYSSAEWDSEREIGMVLFNDGTELYFDYDGSEFSQLEELT